MPVYDFRCKTCNKTHEYIAKFEERQKTCECGGEMDRLITTRYAVIGDIEPYIDEHIGEKPVVVKSRKHRQQLMRENGVYEKFGKGWL